MNLQLFISSIIKSCGVFQIVDEVGEIVPDHFYHSQDTSGMLS